MNHRAYFRWWNRWKYRICRCLIVNEISN